MKQLFTFLSLCAVLSLTSCGGGEEPKDDETQEIKELKGHVELNLAEYGYNISLMVPDETVGVPSVEVTDWGNVEIRVGKAFGIQIIEGPGDFALLKSDLNDDLVFKSEILSEEPDCIIYKRVIPDTQIEPQFNFFYVGKAGGFTYEVQNLKDETYSEGAVKKMVDAVRTLHANTDNTAAGEEQPAS